VTAVRIAAVPALRAALARRATATARNAEYVILLCLWRLEICMNDRQELTFTLSSEIMML
jgi:hypothetical protein